MKVSGLALGTYDVFIVGINTNNNLGTSPANIGARATGDIDTLDITGIANVHVANDFTDSWTAGRNYAKITVTLTAANPVLTLFTVGGSNIDTNNNRGFLNAVMITPVPEPSTYAALLGLLALGFVMYRRRSRR